MSEREPITAELRGVMNHTTMAGVPLVEIGEYEFGHRCDAIDALHASLEAENDALKASVAHAYASGYEYAEQDRDGWIRLPLDADGVPIRVGDVMDSRVDYLFDGKPFTVRALVLCEDGWEVADGRFGNRYEPDSLRHHHVTTVEDVLREFADIVRKERVELATISEDTIAEYAKRLTLAGDAS